MRVIVEPPAGFCPGRLFLLFSRGQVVTMLIPCVLSTGSCHARHCSLLIVAQHHALPEDQRAKLIEILNRSLANAIAETTMQLPDVSLQEADADGSQPAAL